MGRALAQARCLILDAEALSRLATGSPRRQVPILAALKALVRGDGELVTSSAVLTELLRGKHDASIWSTIKRLRITTMPVDDRIAARSGRLLAKARMKSEHAIDAFVAATAETRTPAIVLTGDEADLLRLTAPLPDVIVSKI